MKKKEVKAKLKAVDEELEHVNAWRRKLKRIAKKLRKQL